MAQQSFIRNTVGRTLWITGVFLLGLSAGTAGITLSPCGEDHVQEILADHETNFTCTAEGQVQWRWQLDKTVTSKLVAQCDTECTPINTFYGLFSPSVIDANKRLIIVKTANNTRVYEDVRLVNGSLECTAGDETKRCGLNYVSTPLGVKCSAENISWSIHVTCSIDSIYSSRKIYRCQLSRLTHMAGDKTLETVTMVTSPTSEKITKSEVKVSGSCEFMTSLPEEEGRYAFFVSVAPGGHISTAEDKWFAVERPKSPRVSCGQEGYVLANTTVTCTCGTNSLGQPAGHMRWITGSHTTQEISTGEGQALKQLQYEHYFTESDQNQTWFRCDVIWGTEEIEGEIYTVRVKWLYSKVSYFIFSVNKIAFEHDNLSDVSSFDMKISTLVCYKYFDHVREPRVQKSSFFPAFLVADNPQKRRG